MALLQSYEIPTKSTEFELQLPVGAQVISFFNVDDKPYIGVLVDVAAPGREPRHFTLLPLKAQADTTRLTRLVGVAVFRKDSNPLHLFECAPPEPSK